MGNTAATTADGNGVHTEIPSVGPGEMRIVGERTTQKEGKLANREMAIISDPKVPEKIFPSKRTEKEDKADVGNTTSKGNQGEMRIFGEHPLETESPVPPVTAEDHPVKVESNPPRSTSSGEMHIMGERSPANRESNTHGSLGGEKKVARDPKTENNFG